MKTRILLAASLTGCFGWPPMPADRPDPVIRKLSDGKVLSLDVNLKDLPGVCPGQDTKLYAKGQVLWPGQKPVMRTIGSDIDSFNPASFQVQGPLIEGDQQAHLHPSADVLASIESGFEANIVYTPEAQRFSWHKIMKPEYSCFQQYSNSGAEGDPGGNGNGGAGGNNAEDGGPGDPGTPGGRGHDAGRISAVVTVVATPFYPKLYAVIANNTFYLAPADRELWFVADGGPGGIGGSGGDGGPGGDQPYESRTFHDENGNETSKNVGTDRAGNGGKGGDAAHGGNGGNGGTIDVTYDAKFPELKEWIRVDVTRGAGGAPGNPGGGGAGGQSSAEENVKTGEPGENGAGADGGGEGRDGHASVRSGNVSSKFNAPGIAIFGTPAARAISTKADMPPIADAGGRPPSTRQPPSPPPPPPGPRRRRGHP